MMPVMDGFELLNALKADDELQRIPVIMLTARADLQDKLNALRIGVDDYMLKPFVEEELLARVENSLLRLSMRQPLEEEDVEEVMTPEQEWLQQVEEKVLSELQNTQFNLDQMAAELFMSKRQLQRKIKSYTGMTPSEYVREIRLHRARLHLESGRYQTVGEVCNAVGMEHQHHFSKIFAERYGKKPTDYFKEVA
ncbi:MAG: helix-turn-helix domain-containing protein, partial [Phaeodactylibacter sp.]|nr:helix-turn-helix domain-containing protein [Phaeodactylibacter sp.]